MKCMWSSLTLSGRTYDWSPQILKSDLLRFRQRFKSFTEQYELRELHFHALMRTKECEVQMSLARSEEHRKRAEDEMRKSRTLNSQVSTFSQTETELRSQLNIYVEKFKQARLSQSSLLAALSLHLPFTFPSRLRYAASKHVGVPIATMPRDGCWRTDAFPQHCFAAWCPFLSPI